MNTRGSDHVLNAVRNFISTLWWAPEEYIDALTLVLAVTHVKDAFTTVPYVLMTSDKPKVGKSTGSTDIPMLLADRPWVIDRMVTQDALRNKFTMRESPSSWLFDDASKIFGEGGNNGKTTPVYQLGVNGYRRTGKVSVSRNGVPMDVPAYGVAFYNGLHNAVPGDLATRAIQFRIKPKPDSIRMRDALSVPVAKEAEPLKKALHRWATSNRKQMQQFMLGGVTRIHEKLTDRTLQLWGPVFAVAHAAGGSWPQRAMDAFLDMALDEADKLPVLAEDQLLLDAAKIAMRAGVSILFTGELVAALRALPDDDFYSEVDDAYLVSDLLPRALGPVQELRGKTMDGRTMTGAGRRVTPILEAAAELRGVLNPVTEQAGPDAVQLEMTLR